MRKIRKPNREDVIPVEAEEQSPAPAKKARASHSVTPKKAPKKKVVKKSAKSKNKKSDAPQPAAPVEIKITAKAASPAQPETKDQVTIDTTPVNASETQQESTASELTRREKAFQVVRKYTILSGGASCIPLPAADVITLTGIQADLAEEISKLYGFTPTPGWSLRLAGLFAFSAGGSAIGTMLISSLSKSFPGIGTIAGIGSLAAYGAATTCALGRAIIHHYENGGAPEHMVTSSFLRAIRDSVATHASDANDESSLTE